MSKILNTKSCYWFSTEDRARKVSAAHSWLVQFAQVGREEPGAVPGGSSCPQCTLSTFLLARSGAGNDGVHRYIRVVVGRAFQSFGSLNDCKAEREGSSKQRTLHTDHNLSSKVCLC